MNMTPMKVMRWGCVKLLCQNESGSAVEPLKILAYIMGKLHSQGVPFCCFSCSYCYQPMGNPWKNTEGLQLRHDGKFFGSSAAPTVMLVKSDDSNNLR